MIAPHPEGCMDMLIFACDFRERVSATPPIIPKSQGSLPLSWGPWVPDLQGPSLMRCRQEWDRTWATLPREPAVVLQMRTIQAAIYLCVVGTFVFTYMKSFKSS